MTRKNQKSVQFYLSEEEKEALDEVRGKLSYREYTLRGIVSARPRGRPSLDAATKDLEAQYKQHAEDRQRVILDQLVRANAKGLPEHVKQRMYGDASEWTKVVCWNCKNTYNTKSKNESKCWRCNVVNKTPSLPTEIPTGEPVIYGQFKPAETLDPNTQGNLSEGYNPYYNPASANQLMGGGVGDKSVVGEDHSRFIGKQKKKRG